MTTGTDASDAATVLRPPLAMRAIMLVFICVWFAVVITLFVQNIRRGHHGQVVVPVVFLVVGALTVVQVFRLAVILQPDTLIVRNQLRTRRLPRADIEGFRIGRVAGQLSARTVYALLRDGSVQPLSVLTGQLPFGAGRRRLDERVTLLNNWLAHA